MRAAWRTIIVLAAIPLSSGCLTTLRGATQPVGIASLPRGATVVIDGTFVGTTPVVVTLSRRRSHAIRLDLDCYNPVSIVVERHLSGWALAGGVVDLLSGASFSLNTGQLAVHMEKARDSCDTAAPAAPPAPRVDSVTAPPGG